MTTWIHKVFCTFMGDKSEIGVCWIMAGFAFVLERMKPSRTRRRNKTKSTSTCFPGGRICETALPQGSVLLQTTLWAPIATTHHRGLPKGGSAPSIHRPISRSNRARRNACMRPLMAITRECKDQKGQCPASGPCLAPGLPSQPPVVGRLVQVGPRLVPPTISHPPNYPHPHSALTAPCFTI